MERHGGGPTTACVGRGAIWIQTFRHHCQAPGVSSLPSARQWHHHQMPGREGGADSLDPRSHQQSGPAWIPNPQNIVFCCFKSLNFEIVYYIARNNQTRAQCWMFSFFFSVCILLLIKGTALYGEPVLDHSWAVSTGFIFLRGPLSFQAGGQFNF